MHAIIKLKNNFPVNGPFVCSCLGLICLNLMRFTCFWMSKKLLQRKNFLYTALEFATAAVNIFYTALDQSTSQYKKISNAADFLKENLHFSQNELVLVSDWKICFPS